MNRNATLGWIRSGIILLGFVVITGAPASSGAAARGDAIPDFSSNGKTWVLSSGVDFLKVDGDTGPGPITDKPGFKNKFGEQNHVADTTNPVLKPWAKKLMDIANDRVQAGG